MTCSESISLDSPIDASCEYDHLEVVNIVVSGDLGAGEIDVNTLGTELPGETSVHPGRIYRHHGENDPVEMVYRSGTYTIAGGTTWSEIVGGIQQLVNALREVDCPVDEQVVAESTELKYFVVTADLGQQVNLSAAAIALGVEQSEYEPEQFPALVYRPGGARCTALIFANGKTTITNVTDMGAADKLYQKLKGRILSYDSV